MEQRTAPDPAIGAAPEGPVVRRGNVVLPATLLSAFCAVWIARTLVYFRGRPYLSLFDDGMISMRYARNLASGHGLVWNAGQQHVEGYTNFGWTLWMAAIHAIGLDGTGAVLAVMITAVALTVGGLWIVRAIVEEITPDPRVSAVAVCLTALAYPLAYWAVRGMEVAALATCTSLLVLGALRLRRAPADARILGWMSATTVVAILVRTDAALVCGTVWLLTSAWAPSGRPRRRAVLALGSACVATLAGNTVFRIAYYGDPLPNTYYLKLTGTPLGPRLTRGIDAAAALAVASLLPLLFFAALGLISRWREHPVGSDRVVLLVALVAVPAAYSVYVGGDAWENLQFANRYQAPSLPLLAVLAGMGLVHVLDAPERFRRLALEGLAAASAFTLVIAERAWIPTVGLQYVLAGTRELADRAVATSLAAAVLVGVAITARRDRSRATLAALVVAVALLLDGQALAAWARTTGPHVADDGTMALYGLVIRDSTTPSATVAVMWAGASPYYSGRDSIDLLGKSDVKIAHEASQPVPFYPGHTKWDYAWSIGHLRPDLVADLFRDTPAVDDQLQQWGYDNLAPKIWVRHDSTAVDRDALVAGLAANPRIGELVRRHL